MKFEHTQVFNFDGALRGMRNPLESWSKSDSNVDYVPYSKKWEMFEYNRENVEYVIGKNDLNLAQRLIRGGSEHRKWLRQVFVSVDITAPMYWMAEFDTYKIGIVRDSTSFQHKGTSKEFEIEDFEVPEEMVEVLTKRKSKKEYPLVYAYETDEYKIYTTKSGRSYEVYRNGKIFATDFSYVDTMGRKRVFERKEILPYQNSSGYWLVRIGGRDCEHWGVHRLVAYLWLQNTDNLETVDHLNGNKGDNSVENLEWVSRKENIQRGFENGLYQFDLSDRYKRWKSISKILPDERHKMQEMFNSGEYTQSKLAEIFHISQAQVSVIVKNQNSTSDKRDLFEECYMWEKILENLNTLRYKYIETKDYDYFKMIRKILPSSYLYTSTVTMNYENIRNMVHQRKGHKLTEWNQFIDWAYTLPYAEELIFYNGIENS